MILFLRMPSMTDAAQPSLRAWPRGRLLGAAAAFVAALALSPIISANAQSGSAVETHFSAAASFNRTDAGPTAWHVPVYGWYAYTIRSAYFRPFYPGVAPASKSW
jgi:hypothetical protein